MPLAMRFTARSHVGRVRPGNEDSAYAGQRLLVLADGMGGHAAGEVASAAAITALTVLDLDGFADPGERLVRAVTDADQALRERIVESPDREGMGTTLTALYWDGRAFTLAHVGDSRAYRLRAGVLEQISHDHTFVQTLVDEGRLTREEAANHPQRSLILRALDGTGRAEPDIERYEVQDGDRYLLCSDGLSDYVPERAIEEACGLVSLDDAADRLIELALGNGAPDNVTVVLAAITDADDTGVLPPAGESAGPGFLVGAVAEDEASREAAAAAAAGHPPPDRRLHDPEEDTPENQAEVARYAPQEPGRRRWVRPVIGSVVVLALLGGAAWAGLAWTRTQYYVGIESGELAIFRGIDQEVIGQPLYEVYEVVPVPVEELPTFDQTAVSRSIPADDLRDAQDIADRLAIRAATCERFRAEAGEPAPPPTDVPPTDEPTDTPTASPTRTGGGGGGGGRGGTTSPTSPTSTADPSGPTGTASTTETTPGDEPTTSRTARPTEPSDEEQFTGPVTREECGVTR